MAINTDTFRRPSVIAGIALAGVGVAGAFFARRFLTSGGPESLSLSAKNEFIDKCTARWLFEKTGVRLYDRLLSICPPEVRDRLQHFRDEEKEHEELLEGIIRKYGADPHSRTESARITEIESKGIIEVIENEGFEAGLDALLAAELVDNAGWDLLCKLARKVGDVEAYAKFSKAMVAEAQHLVYIRKLVIREAEELLAGRGHHQAPASSMVV